MSLAVSGCTSEEQLLPDARCSNEVVASKQDAEKILELAPDGLERLEHHFYERDSQGYLASCNVSDGSGREGLAITFDAGFLSETTPPSEKSLRELAEPLAVDGRLTRVTSDAPGVGGVSGAASAILYAPCTLSKSETLPPDMREGAMVANARAELASDPDSLEQRQNAADLALSFLRNAVRKCDDPPKLPESVDINE